MRTFFILPLLIAPLLAHAQESAFCQKKCDEERLQCRTAAEARSKLDANPPLQIRDDRTRDLQSVLGDGQRIAGAERRLRGERYERCDESFGQCRRDCRSAEAGVVDVLIRK